MLGIPEKELTYITPHRILDLIKEDPTPNCPAITYKHLKGTKKFFLNKDLPIINLFKETSINLGSKYVSEMKNRDKEALWFMKGVMDECTHLKNFSVPVDTSLIIAICAKADGYVPRHGTSRLEDIWPGLTVKYVDAGHVGAYIWYRQLFM